MKKIKFLTAIMVVIALCGVMVGCGGKETSSAPNGSLNIGKPTVNLNDYVSIVDDGFDGYGTVCASVDFDKIVDDYSSRLSTKLDSQIFGDKTPEVAAEFTFDHYEPFVLSYEVSNARKNGDIVSFTWNTNDEAIKTLSSVIDVKFTYENFTHEVKDLAPLVEIDPFENFVFDTRYMWGESGTGGILDSIDFYEVPIADDSSITFSLTVDTTNSGSLSNGDIVHVEIDYVENAEYYATNYGIILTRTDADIAISGYPEA